MVDEPVVEQRIKRRTQVLVSPAVAIERLGQGARMRPGKRIATEQVQQHAFSEPGEDAAGAPIAVESRYSPSASPDSAVALGFFRLWCETANADPNSRARLTTSPISSPCSPGPAVSFTRWIWR